MEEEQWNFVKKYGRWYFFLFIFVLLQIAFFFLDGYEGWHLFQLNPFGEWTMNYVSPLVDWLPLYTNSYFNLVTIVWGIVLTIEGIIFLYRKTPSN
ncbi:hypothetical protein SPD48_18570 [Pseudogracilibacillus sp. SE30717A]|uniref:hypothetical protein n=1 Tax=Pseudogracilibacillus sp. SE30717A TaxID=3098293 RepID=UPI00300E23E7